MTAFVRLGPRIATMDSASTSVGKARSASITRIRMVSAQPPKCPAIRPRAVPTTAAAPTEPSTITSATRAPQMVRA